MRNLIKWALILATLGLAAASFAALIETNRWWIRMTDFPRLQYAIGLLVLLVLIGMARAVPVRVRAMLAAAALAALAYNAVKIGPYLLGTRGELAACAPDSQISVMVANVQLRNRDAGGLVRLVRDRSPDLLLALETNEWWDEELSALAGEMPHTVSEITGSYFGMHLFSRLPLSQTETIYPVEQDTPAILATVTLPSEDTARFIGLHPRPPHPGQSSTGRDAELMWAALRAREAGPGVILAGDMNATPWERTVERTQRIGALIDPRDDSGFLPTYDAKSWWMSWPLDQVLHGSGLSVMEMEVLPGFGSDHYPVEVTLCHRPSGREAPELRPDDMSEARTTLDAALEGRAEAH
ncbi:endonuclease/exonuclease/phosphatase family protein [Roseicyclus sp. F158]|uniref:Endonuclease/exonuclease/phosphatase family protein n=1 Tax=Tropicimonas omnivorans TaxID=3075590 RepID=A0ABU3DC26_9RHOB|nr:endonuclease/exonuclease/phosphatase family protein [Roseicyclus sp. F158]MDT0681258.1 endonuclease/exonuclease/phosphatase family protein [Roseicyclus sp. F158]